LKAKADRLFELFTNKLAAEAPELELVTPRDPDRRGSQASIRFGDGYAAMQALIERGIIGDFREPDIMRFGFAPLYLSHAETWRAADALAAIMRSAAWDRPHYRVRAKVV